jgi:GxxExxY protein
VITNHGDTETRSKPVHESLIEQIGGALIEVPRTLGPGLPASACLECLGHELHLRGVGFQRQAPLPVQFKAINLDCGYGIDIVVEDAVILELSCAVHILAVHEAQLLT